MATKLAFTTLREDQGQPLFWSMHWQRLLKSWKYFGLPSVPNEKELFLKVCQFFKEQPDQILRIDLLDDQRFEFNSRSVVCRDSEALLKLSLSENRLMKRSIPPWLKAGDYSWRMSQRELARKKSFDDYLYLDEQEKIAEATVSNLIWCKGSTFFTPQVSEYILQGITVSLFLENHKNNFTCSIFDLNDLLGADAAWLVNAVTGPQRIASLDQHKFSSKLPQVDLDQLYWGLVKQDRKTRSE